ncbi:MAG: hypothetical protein RRZ73_00320 [Oscillospiraceae bacterium]
MSALGALLVVYLVLAVLVLAGVITLFIVKKEKTNNVILVLLALLTILLSYLGATSMPTNYIFEQVIAWTWGVLAIVGVALNFFTPKFAKYTKYLVMFAAAASLIDIIFI